MFFFVWFNDPGVLSDGVISLRQIVIDSGAYIAAEDEYKATSIPALRMIIPLDDPDSMQINVPMGQSGQPGHKHYDDMTEGWLKGELVHFPVSRDQVESTTVCEMTLSP